MKTTFRFIINMLKASLVFMVAFSLPAIMVSLVWLDFSLYKACVSHPSYCVIMFILALLLTCVYMDARIEKSKD